MFRLKLKLNPWVFFTGNAFFLGSKFQKIEQGTKIMFFYLSESIAIVFIVRPSPDLLAWTTPIFRPCDSRKVKKIYIYKSNECRVSK